MVDPIEVKLDEIEEFEIKNWEQLQRLMRDWSKPETPKEILKQLPAAPAGLLDQAIGKLTKVLPGGQAMAAGMAGGLAAGGIMALVQIIGEALSSSRILMTTLKLISTALGLLVDVILLPFLPILIMGILWLFRGIMQFHQLWSKIWNSAVIQALKTGIENLGSFLKEGFGMKLLLLFNPVGVGAVVWDILKWLYKLLTENDGLVTIQLNMMVEDIIRWIYGVFTGAIALGTMGLEFNLGLAGDILKWLKNAVTEGIKIALNFTNNATEMVTGAVNKGAGMLGEAAKTGGDWLSGLLSGGWLPSFQTGGVVPGAGPQLVIAHGGEEIRKPGQGGNTTFQFYGYDDARLKRSVEDILRREQNRYNS